jgi:hypothetical protein
MFDVLTEIATCMRILVFAYRRDCFAGGRNPSGQIEEHYFGRAFKEHYPQLETLRLVELKPRVATKTILCVAFIFRFESKIGNYRR